MGYVTKEEVKCKRCGRTIHKKELQYDSPEGRICLECYKSKGHLLEYRLVLQTTPPREMPRRKNPLVVAILNFLFPGVGFIYLETKRCVVAGTVLFVLSAVFVAWPLILFALGDWTIPIEQFGMQFVLTILICAWFVLSLIITLPILVVLGFLWAFLGARAADRVNVHAARS